MSETTPDLLDLLDLLTDHGPCDYQAGYLDGLRRAATYVQDYGHQLPRGAVVAVQSAILRAVQVAECPECNPLGCVVDADGRHVEHHPIGGK